MTGAVNIGKSLFFKRIQRIKSKNGILREMALRLKIMVNQNVTLTMPRSARTATTL
jgi:hypothetical protein